MYETFSNEIDTNEWVIIADSLYIGDGGEDIIAKHQVTNTILTLVASYDENMLGFNTVTINGSRRKKRRSVQKLLPRFTPSAQSDRASPSPSHDVHGKRQGQGLHCQFIVAVSGLDVSCQPSVVLYVLSKIG